MAEILRNDIFENKKEFVHVLDGDVRVQIARGTSQNHVVRVLEQLTEILKDPGSYGTIME